jgi:chromosomal replication initiation ATPase DnaA
MAGDIQQINARIDRQRKRMATVEASDRAAFDTLRKQVATVMAVKSEPPTDVADPLHKIMAEVSEETGIPIMHLRGPRRNAPLAKARAYGWWRSREETGASLPQIARVWHRDHTTVIHGIRMHEKRLAEAWDAFGKLIDSRAVTS